MVDGRGHWGAHEQTQRLQNAERQAELDQAARAQRIIDNNNELDAIRIRHGGDSSGRGIDVTFLRHMYPSNEADSRPDRLMVTTSDRASAAWLLDKLRDSPDPCSAPE